MTTDADREELEALAADPASDAMFAPIIEQASRYENALLWIRHIAALHYLGDAYEPEHMRTLANIAADALVDLRRFPDVRQMPDYEEATEKAREEAERLAAFFLGDEEDGA